MSEQSTIQSPVPKRKTGKIIAFIIASFSIGILLGIIFASTYLAFFPRTFVYGEMSDRAGEVVAYRELMYTYDDKLIACRTYDKDRNVLFTLVKPVGYTMYGGYIDENNPDRMSIALQKNGDDKSINYFFLNGKPVCKQTIVHDSEHARCSSLTLYKDNCKKFLTYTPSVKNEGRSIWYIDQNNVQERSNDGTLICDIKFDEKSGEIISRKKYIYDNNGLQIGNVTLDKKGNVSEISLEHYVYEYKQESKKTIALFDYDGINYGSRIYQNGYIVQ